METIGKIGYGYSDLCITASITQLHKDALSYWNCSQLHAKWSTLTAPDTLVCCNNPIKLQ